MNEYEITDNENNVAIKDIDIPFERMVRIFIKMNFAYLVATFLIALVLALPTLILILLLK